MRLVHSTQRWLSACDHCKSEGCPMTDAEVREGVGVIRRSMGRGAIGYTADWLEARAEVERLRTQVESMRSALEGVATHLEKQAGLPKAAAVLRAVLEGRP